jgi:hypothetical protein
VESSFSAIVCGESGIGGDGIGDARGGGMGRVVVVVLVAASGSLGAA